MPIMAMAVKADPQAYEPPAAHFGVHVEPRLIDLRLLPRFQIGLSQHLRGRLGQIGHAEQRKLRVIGTWRRHAASLLAPGHHPKQIIQPKEAS
jgi:hypothetical protein